MIYCFDLFGTFVFAVTGALAAGKKELDLFGVIVVATVTALGGGTLRDLILDVNIFWLSDHAYIIVAFVAAVATFLLCRVSKPPYRLLLIADAFGLSVFTVIGADKALDRGASGMVSVIMGVMTGVVGGMIRDILSGEIPLILRREIYATASLCGAVALVSLRALDLSEDLGTVVALAVVLSLRLAALKWNLSLPVFFLKR